MGLAPVATVTDDALVAGKRALVQDAAWASLTGALSGGVVLAAFALSVGAGPRVIGLIAAIPFLAQVMQLPAVLLVERLARRKLIGVIALGVARLAILGLAFVPFLADRSVQLTTIIVAQVAIASLGACAACALNSWFHQLLPRDGLGAFFARRLFVSTAIACVGTLAAGFLVDNPPAGDARYAYAIAFALAGLAGFASTAHIARTPEPMLERAGPKSSLRAALRAPFADPQFRPVLVLLAAWNFATNLAMPFLTVYLIQQLHYGVASVTALWVAGQAASAVTLYLWGRISDRLSNKSILAVALPIYFACTVGLVFTAIGTPFGLQLALLYALHVVMGAAAGGIGLATGNLGLKLAPRGLATSYLAAVGLVSAIAGGIAPILGGVVAQALAASELSIVVRWASPTVEGQMSLARFAHWEFLFAMSALCGLYVMHALSRVREGREVSERLVIQEFAFEAIRTVNGLSTIAGLLGSLFPFERLFERRRFWGRSARTEIDRT
jgi:MFS family permease